MSSKLPMDDGVLELEEVEGLIQTKPLTAIRSSNVGSGARRSTAGSCASSRLATMCDGQYRLRWGCLLTTLAVLLVVLLLADTDTIHETGDTIDVEGKNASSHVVVVESTEAPSTDPKEVATPPPSPEPTVAVTPPPSPEPTVTATSPPTADPTAAATEAATTQEASTSAPTDSAPTSSPTVVDATSDGNQPGGTSLEIGASTEVDPSTLPPAMLERWNKGESWRPKDYVVRNEREYESSYLEELKKKWGTWDFVDPKAESRPKVDFAGAYPNRDVPRDKFPATAWQTDSEYLKDFLKEGESLLQRAMDAILAEYGHGDEDEPDKSFEERSAMFKLEFHDLNKRHLDRALRGPVTPTNGGWTTERSFQGLVRRLLHSVMTQDTFTVILGGHSAAAGHGNQFRQSYMMQFHQVLEPVMSYLGVKLISRNLAQGGLGTLQSGMGAGSIYGEEMDVLLWDSGMTEGRDGRAIDMFLRQGLIGGNRVPFLWNGDWGMLTRYHNEIDADVGVWGTGESGIPTIMNATHAKSVAYAARWIKCDPELKQLCRDHKYNSNCWVDRPDVTPQVKQAAHPPSQVSWHPGNRSHQLTGRLLAFTILRALKEAFSQWSKIDGYALPDDAWHVTAYYENIKTKFKNLKHDSFPCSEYAGTIPERMCWTPMKALTQFTPRANPLHTSITSIIRPDSTGYIPYIATDVLYDGPNVHNPLLDIPEGEIDVQAILNNGRQFPEDPNQRRLSNTEGALPSAQRKAAGDEIVPGKGFEMSEEPPGYCDGSWNAVCRREPKSDCLLLDHADARGGIKFDSLSGWLIMDVPKVKEGIIVSKMETWHSGLGRTASWKTVNNERRLRAGTSETIPALDRDLKAQPPVYCDNFKFEFAIDGKLTTWTGEEEFLKHDQALQRVVEDFVLLDDENWSGEKDVEVAMRMTGCPAGHRGGKTFRFTHLYWA